MLLQKKVSWAGTSTMLLKESTSKELYGVRPSKVKMMVIVIFLLSKSSCGEWWLLIITFWKMFFLKNVAKKHAVIRRILCISYCGLNGALNRWFWLHLWNPDYLSGANCLHVILTFTVTLSQVFFKHFASKT